MGRGERDGHSLYVWGGRSQFPRKADRPGLWRPEKPSRRREPGGAGCALKLSPAAGGGEDCAGGISGSKSKESRNALSLRFCFFFLNLKRIFMTHQQIL